jgi:hypothetical protein
MMKFRQGMLCFFQFNPPIDNDINLRTGGQYDHTQDQAPTIATSSNEPPPESAAATLAVWLDLEVLTGGMLSSLLVHGWLWFFIPDINDSYSSWNVCCKVSV